MRPEATTVNEEAHVFLAPGAERGPNLTSVHRRRAVLGWADLGVLT